MARQAVMGNYGPTFEMDAATPREHFDGSSIALTIDSSVDGFVPLDPSTAFASNTVVPERDGPAVQQPVQAHSPDAVRRAALLSHIGQPLTMTASIGLSSVDKRRIASWHGLLGTVVVDCSLFASNKEYSQFVANSPFRGLVQYAVHCTCGSHVNRTKKARAEEVNLDPIGAALTASNPETERVAFCKKFGVPVLAGMDAYTEADAIDVIQKLVEQRVVNVNAARKWLGLAASKGKPLLYVRELFRSVAKRRAAQEMEERRIMPDPVVGSTLQPSELLVSLSGTKADVDVGVGMDKPVELTTLREDTPIDVTSRADAAENIQLSGVPQIAEVDPSEVKLGKVTANKPQTRVKGVAVRRPGVVLGSLEEHKASVEVDGSETVDGALFFHEPLEIVPKRARKELDVHGSRESDITF